VADEGDELPRQSAVGSAGAKRPAFAVVRFGSSQKNRRLPWPVNQIVRASRNAKAELRKVVRPAPGFALVIAVPEQRRPGVRIEKADCHRETGTRKIHRLAQ